MIKISDYRIRSAAGKNNQSTKEMTLPPKWLKEHDIEIGDEVSVISGRNVLIVLAPGINREEEDRILRFAREEKR